MGNPDNNMRVSKYYKLGRTQPSLDFVDVDIAMDTPVFISPKAIAMQQSEWADRCVSLIQNFFETVLDLIKNGKDAEARKLLGMLREPNETHLGLSKGKSRGRALGSESAKDVWRALSKSEAAKSGLLKDLEDTVLLIEGISVDIVSDIATNIIRQPLIEYTQEMAELMGIPLVEGVASGPMWEPRKKAWFTDFVKMPVTKSGTLLLVPKSIVRRHLEYDAGEYYRHYLLEHLRVVELTANSGLVEVLKNKKRRVTKKALAAKYGTGKKTIVRETLKHPEVLERYKKAKEGKESIPLTHEEIADLEGQASPDWDTLLKNVTSIPTGKEHAGDYEKAVEALLTALFYPDLTHPRLQHKIHDGRKRIDVTYTNMAQSGFFKWVAAHYTAMQIFVECKNYGKDVANPELDQLTGRFGPSRGIVGLSVSRKFKNKARFLETCRDTAKDQRGFVIALDDDDLKALVEARKSEALYQNWTLLRARFQALID